MCNTLPNWSTPARSYHLIEPEDDPSCLRESIRSSSLDIANVERTLDGLPKLTPEEYAENLFNEMNHLLEGPVSDAWKLVEIEIALDPKDKQNQLAVYMDHVNEGLDEAFPNRIREDKAA